MTDETERRKSTLQLHSEKVFTFRSLYTVIFRMNEYGTNYTIGGACR